MPKLASPKYRATDWSEYNAASKRFGSLEIWFDSGIAWLAAANSRSGPPQQFSDNAIELCLTLEVLFGLALRQVTGLVASILSLAKLDWAVPDCATLSRRQKTLAVMFGGRPNSSGLHLLVDSTGIKMTGEGEWKTLKYGASCRRQWRHPQTAEGSRVARPASALDIPLRANVVFLAERHRGRLRQANPPAPKEWDLLIRRRFPGRH